MGSPDELRLLRGRPLPLGASPVPGGVNFAVVAAHATGLRLVLFESGDATPCRELRLDPAVHRTGQVWHALVGGVGVGWEYAFRAEREGADGSPRHRYDPDALLLEPYARAVRGAERWGEGERRRARRGCVVGAGPPPPLGERPGHDLADSILYELHVRGFTRHPSSGAASPGTFRGLIEKIPYLLELGVTAVELLPVAEFEENDNPHRDPESGVRLKNFWGYQPLAWFAPRAAYAASGEAGGEIGEFRELVRALHAAGIELFLDVVFNHTGEGGEADGWSVSLRGLDNALYYLLDPQTGLPVDLTGCGNTLACNRPVLRRLIVDCLRYWVVEMGVDGFRFDLASVLTRGRDGVPLAEPPLLEEIAGDPVLAEVKLIVEPWDLGGLYQVGSFPGGGRFAEWNGRFRDDLRRFVRGDRGSAPALAERLAGSPDLYRAAGGSPRSSVNFVTSHDGFTLADLVSYERKHNRRNGEGSRDGEDQSLSSNCGVEGASGDPEILRLRLRQRKNFAALLLVARGVPMLLAGDEMGRSQGGNNNAYCHDNEISWLDWGLLDRERELFAFVQGLIRFRKRHPALRARSFEESPVELVRCDREAPFLALELTHPEGDRVLLLANATSESVDCRLPGLPPGTAWCRSIDTALAPPADIAPPGVEPIVEGQRCYRCEPRSVGVLIAARRS